MKNIHILPTDKDKLDFPFIAKNCFNNNYTIVDSTFKDNCELIGMNICITNSEEIKEERCWVINSMDKIESVPHSKWGKLIILTTDQELIKDGVQAIPDDFLEWFVKNSNCEYVEVKSEILYEHKDTYRPYPSDCKNLSKTKVNYYLSIISKEEPKALTKLEIAKNIASIGIGKKEEPTISEEAKQRAKNYMSLKGALEPKQEIAGYRLKPSIDRMMVDGILKNAMPIWNDKDKSVYFIKGHVAGSLVAKMKELQVLDLWFTPIHENEEVKSGWLKENHLDYYYKEGVMSNEPKQETLEEAKKRYLDSPTPHSYRLAVEFGAKWKEERSYSEEDMKLAFHVGFNVGFNDETSPSYLTFEKWFEQFKKK